MVTRSMKDGWMLRGKAWEDLGSCLTDGYFDRSHSGVPSCVVKNPHEVKKQILI